jgi:hypothetical protein
LLCNPDLNPKERIAALVEEGVTYLNVMPVGASAVSMTEKRGNGARCERSQGDGARCTPRRLRTDL